MFEYQKVDVVGMTYPTMEEFSHVTTIGEFIDHCARVSNPNNQSIPQNSNRLLDYLIRNQHWSPFEMASITMKITTTRDIARQMLRHRSFAFQEFSQRYAEVDVEEFISRPARMQDRSNRQNSIPTDDKTVIANWKYDQYRVKALIAQAYSDAIKDGIAKEQARAILPEGMTPSTLYMGGTVRSWIHYCDLRRANGTQLEHADIANKALHCLLAEVPALKGYFEDEEHS